MGQAWLLLAGVREDLVVQTAKECGPGEIAAAPLAARSDAEAVLLRGDS